MGSGTQNTQMYGDPLYDTSGISWKSGYTSPRVQQTTHGKQIGIQYLIKGLLLNSLYRFSYHELRYLFLLYYFHNLLVNQL